MTINAGASIEVNKSKLYGIMCNGMYNIGYNGSCLALVTKHFGHHSTNINGYNCNYKITSKLKSIKK